MQCCIHTSVYYVTYMYIHSFLCDVYVIQREIQSSAVGSEKKHARHKLWEFSG